MAVELADIVERYVVVGEETTMEDKVLLANEGSERQGRETFRKELEGSIIMLAI